MAEMTEIRWHGSGGQGTVTAAKVLADACLSGGRHVQAFPEYGPERAGAPLRAYNRISSKELRMHCPVLSPDVVSVVDATLLDSINIAEGAKEDTVYIINTTKDPKEIRQKLGCGPETKSIHRRCDEDRDRMFRKGNAQFPYARCGLQGDGPDHSRTSP